MQLRQEREVLEGLDEEEQGVRRAQVLHLLRPRVRVRAHSAQVLHLLLLHLLPGSRLTETPAPSYHYHRLQLKHEIHRLCRVPVGQQILQAYCNNGLSAHFKTLLTLGDENGL